MNTFLEKKMIKHVKITFVRSNIFEEIKEIIILLLVHLQQTIA